MSKDMADYMGLYCNMCGKNVYENKGDYFMLKDEVWAEVCDNNYVSPTHVLCKKCTEHFLGRSLTKEDYKNAPVNDFLLENKDE